MNAIEYKLLSHNSILFGNLFPVNPHTILESDCTFYGTLGNQINNVGFQLHKRTSTTVSDIYLFSK